MDPGSGPTERKIPVNLTLVVSIFAVGFALYTFVVPITTVQTQFENLDERTLRMEREFDAKIRNLDITLQREYRMIAERLDTVADRATKDIGEDQEALKKLRDDLHALALKVGK